MKNRICYYILILGEIIMLAGCGEKKAPEIPVLAAKKPEIMAPFRYHEMIEVSPGQDFDVLSWGRGSKTKGAFEILHSDSAAAKYTTTTGDLDGDIVNAYNSDMDLDGNPEILIQVKENDTVNYTGIYAFEFDNSVAHKLLFPKLTRSQREGYRGQDNFYIKDGKLIREFPIYNGNTKAATLTGQKRQFEYGLRDNIFTVKQISKDSTSVKSAAQKTKKAPEKKPEKKATSSKKHKSSATKKKKRRSRG